MAASPARLAPMTAYLTTFDLLVGFGIFFVNNILITFSLACLEMKKIRNFFILSRAHVIIADRENLFFKTKICQKLFW